MQALLGPPVASRCQFSGRRNCRKTRHRAMSRFPSSTFRLRLRERLLICLGRLSRLFRLRHPASTLRAAPARAYPAMPLALTLTTIALLLSRQFSHASRPFSREYGRDLGLPKPLAFLRSRPGIRGAAFAPPILDQRFRV